MHKTQSAKGMDIDMKYKKVLVCILSCVMIACIGGCGKEQTVSANAADADMAEVKPASIKAFDGTDNSNTKNDADSAGATVNSAASSSDNEASVSAQVAMDDYINGKGRTSYFVENKIKVYQDIPKELDYTWLTYTVDASNSGLVNGKWKFIEAHREPATEPGYENIVLVCEYENENGLPDEFDYISYWDCAYDYYTGAKIPGTGTYNNENYVTSIDLEGTDSSYTICNSNGVSWDENDFKLAVRTYIFRVPEGYDGIVLNVSSHNIKNEKKRLIAWTGIDPTASEDEDTDPDEVAKNTNKVDTGNYYYGDEEIISDYDSESENEIIEDDNIEYAVYEEGDNFIRINPD